jgi:hypothetical protein
MKKQYIRMVSSTFNEGTVEQANQIIEVENEAGSELKNIFVDRDCDLYLLFEYDK